MLSPGSKGWILKYFALVEKGEIVPVIQTDTKTQYFKHLVFSRSGIIFGYPSEFIFSNDIDHNKWTFDEQLTYLLFECHLYVYLQNGGSIHDRDKFIIDLLDFYEHHSVMSLSKIFTFFLKEPENEKLEKILDRRTEVKKNLIESALWVNYLSNTFIYLDVILFDEFLRTKRTLGVSNYETYAENALNALCLAAYADGKAEHSEKQLFEIFLASAKIGERKKDQIEKLFKADNSISIISREVLENELFRYFLLDISVLTIYANHSADVSEKKYLTELNAYLNLSEQTLYESQISVENFVLKHNDQIKFLSNANAVEKLYDSVSQKWIKILGRNKDKLAVELKQSKELIRLIKKSTKQELTKAEKEMVKTQFMDIVKSMPALAIFMLPGGALLLPLVLKIIPDLIPSAFRDNEID